MKTATATVYGGLLVTIGSRVVYPGRQGSRMWLNEGVVEDIVTEKSQWTDREFTQLKVRRQGTEFKCVDGQWVEYPNDTTKLVTVTELDRVVPLNA